MPTGSFFGGEVTGLIMPRLDVGDVPRDLIGNADWLSIHGGPTYDSEGLIFNSLSQYGKSKIEAGGGELMFDMTQDYTEYMILKILSAVGNTSENYYKPDTFSATSGHYVAPEFEFNRFKFATTGSAVTDASPKLTNPRDYNVDEYVLLASSYDHSAKVMNAVVYSRDSSDPLVLSGTDTGAGDPTMAGNFWWFFRTASPFVYSHVNLLEMGAINGTAKSLIALGDEAQVWVDAAPSEENGAIISPIITPIEQPFFSPLI